MSNTTGYGPTTLTSESPLRIGFFTDFYFPVVSGIAVSLQLLVRQLRLAGHEATIFAPRFPGHLDAEPMVCRIPSVFLTDKPMYYAAVPGTPRTTLTLRRSRFDILHVHSPFSIGMMGYFTARAKHVPLIYTYHTSLTDYTHYVKIGGQSRFARSVARWYSTATGNLSDQIVVPSAKFKRVLQEQHVHRPIHLIPNGIDLGNFQPSKSPGEFRRRLGLGHHEPLLLYVGRLAPEKRVDVLINAFDHVASRYADAHLILAGDGNSRGDLESLASASQHSRQIHFLGMLGQAEVPDLLHAATLFLSASTSEVHPISMLEALAAGLPVVAVWDDAFEGMLVDGVNGYVASREPMLFGAAICRLLADRASLRAFAQNSTELSRKFSVDAQVASLVSLYRSAIERNTARIEQRFAGVASAESDSYKPDA